MKKLDNFFNFYSFRKIFFPNGSFSKLTPSKSIWKKIIYIRGSKVVNGIFGMNRPMTLATKGNKIRNAVIRFITINMVRNQSIMSSATLTPMTISFKSNFFVQIEGSAINFGRFFTSSTDKPSKRRSSIFKFAFTTFNQILSYQHNLNSNILQSLCQGDC